MKVQVAPSAPWRPSDTRLALRGRLEVVVREEGAFEEIATNRSVRLGAAMAATRVDGGPLDRVLRRFSPGFRVTRTYGSAAHAGLPAQDHQGWDELEHSSGLSRTFRVDVDPEADLGALADGLADLEAVESCCPVYLTQAPFAQRAPREATEALLADTSLFDMVGARRALAMEEGDPALIVAIIDSGVQAHHPELREAVRPGADTVDLIQDLLARGMRFMGRGGNPDAVRDDVGHGTGCASIIAARGLRVHPGLGGAARVLPMRALAKVLKPGSTQPTAIGAVPDINAAVKLAVDLGAKVLNLSFGTPRTALRPTDPIPHKAVVRYALERGCIPIAASGNKGDWTVYYPAALPGVIAVGSVDASGDVSRFSCRGEHVAISAPGEDIPCAGLDGYALNTGTSFAAPFVAATAALLVARAHRHATPLKSHHIEEILVRSAAAFGRGTDSRGSGSGVLDMPAALGRLDDLIRGPPEERFLSPWIPHQRPSHLAPPGESPVNFNPSQEEQ